MENGSHNPGVLLKFDIETSHFFDCINPEYKSYLVELTSS